MAHRIEIEELRDRLSRMTEAEADTVATVKASRFGHPVLFVSHRWESERHPDPSGSQLAKLRKLRDCFVVYDYCSFPQPPMTQLEHAELRAILENMDRLIQNVVVLDGPDYLTRGWCVYEYLVASVTHSTVCDEIDDEGFTTLRDWSATHASIPQNPFRGSWESQQQNHINHQILESAFRVLPAYQGAGFTVEADREIVTTLLLRHLKERLPPKKKHQEYMGEWQVVPWTDEELEMAVTGRLTIPPTQRAEVARFRSEVPRTIAEAVENSYAVKQMSLEDLVDPLFGLFRRWTRG